MPKIISWRAIFLANTFNIILSENIINRGNLTKAYFALLIVEVADGLSVFANFVLGSAVAQVRPVKVEIDHLEDSWVHLKASIAVKIIKEAFNLVVIIRLLTRSEED